MSGPSGSFAVNLPIYFNSSNYVSESYREMILSASQITNLVPSFEKHALKG